MGKCDISRQTGRVSGWTPAWDDIGRTFTFAAQAGSGGGSARAAPGRAGGR